MTPVFPRHQSPERAFERLYRTHVHDVYRYALMVMRNRHDAEDVAQTTFMKAYRAYTKGQEPRNPRPWLIAIAQNTCKTRMRDAKRRPQEVELQEQIVEATPRGGDDAVDPQELLRALGELTFNQRAALVMRELEDRSYEEIADVLELSTSAVETLLFRARRALREQLEGALTCGEAERSLSRDLDGLLSTAEQSQLRAHLRSCRECAGLARRTRARRAALRGLGPLQLPASLVSWGGGGAAGTAIAVKVAAVLAAGAAAVGTTQGVAEAEAVTPPPAHERTAVVSAAPSEVTSQVVVPKTRTADRAEPAARNPTKARARAKGLEDFRPGETAEAASAPASPPTSSAERAPAQEASESNTVPVSAPVQLPVEVPEVPEVPSAPALPAAPAAPAVPPLPPVEVPKVPELPPVPPILP
jgi:RNA polymerase sigma factor (sigma-70 family)